MGVDYRAILYVGREFEGQHEAKDWYEKFVELSEEDQKIIEEEGFIEYLSTHKDISGEIINYYHPSLLMVVGIDLSGFVRKPELFTCEITKAIEVWKKTFGEEPYSIVHTVKVY